MKSVQIKFSKTSKTAEGLSLQAVAVAAIILVVVIIVIAIFKGGIDRIIPTLNKVNECKDSLADRARGFGCMEAGQCKSGQEVFGLGCDKKDPNKPYCCIERKT